MSQGDIATAYGPLSPLAYQRLFPIPFGFVQEWQWARPLQAILQFSGYSIDSIVDDPRAAAEVRALWKIWRIGERLRAQREREVEILDVLWWRAMGCPVPCILCSRLGPCSCGTKEPYASRLRAFRKRGTGQMGSTFSLF